jgi:hypothetical protein
MANRNYPNGGKLYMRHVKPVEITCNFIVDSTNGNGFGIRSLKGPGLANVFMHTSASPAGGNPNPAAGYIMVQLQDNYFATITGGNTLGSPLSGTPLTSVTAGNAYTIVSVGTTTQANWAAIGLPAGMVPNVGSTFIATTSASITGTGAVEVPLSTGSGITNIEILGDPNQTIATTNPPQPGFGATVILACMKNGVLTAPANNTVISLSFVENESSVSAGHPTPGN